LLRNTRWLDCSIQPGRFRTGSGRTDVHQPFAELIAAAPEDARRTAPVELIGFDASAARFVDQTGGIELDFADMTRQQWFSGLQEV
jgi:hypothetical protein